MTRIALLDYGMGNLHSAAKALEHVGATVDVTNDPKLIAQADKIVFPGVGAMRDCMQGMHEAGIDEVVRHAAFNKPVLAICVGMQALLESSEENAGTQALGIFEGVVKHFPDMDGLKVPHMGWNQVHQADPNHPMWKDIDQDSRFYFVHSYYVEPKDPSLVAATCDYGLQFCTAIHKENLFATQFHPEKEPYSRFTVTEKLCGMENLIYSGQFHPNLYL